MKNLLLGMGFVCILTLVHRDFAKAQEASNAMKPIESTGQEESLLGLTVKFPRCEYRVDPLAIDEPAPRLSWIVESSRRAQRQTAYRILVVDSLARLEVGEGNLWDSGKVASSRTNPIVYEGKPLGSRMQCFWKVQVWDGEDRASAWSESARWTMGLLNEAEKQILEVSQRKNSGVFQNIKDVLVKTYDNIETLHNRKGEITGIETGFTELDRMTAGFQRNDLIIIAARPSVGKTAFALNIAQNVAVKARENVAIFSLEMGAEQLVMRMLCAEGNINAQNLRTGQLTAEDWSKLTMAMGSLSNAGIYIDDTPGIRVSEIRSKCRRLKQESGLGMILIDYLQLIQGSGRNGGENRQQEVSEISRSLKALARELQVPVIALSQLSRGVEQRQDKRPMMSDIRESGSIEQDADIVGFLYRDDYYDKESENKNIIEIILRKRRGTNGAKAPRLSDVERLVSRHRPRRVSPNVCR